jgi:hypothetical protein
LTRVGHDMHISAHATSAHSTGELPKRLTSVWLTCRTSGLSHTVNSLRQPRCVPSVESARARRSTAIDGPVSGFRALRGVCPIGPGADPQGLHEQPGQQLVVIRP